MSDQLAAGAAPAPDDPVRALLQAIDTQDAAALRGVYTADAQLVTMTPSTFAVDEGGEAAAAKLAEWYTTWEQRPSFSFLATTRDGDRATIEFERVSTYEDAPWVVRQAHSLELRDGRIARHRIVCCGARAGGPDLAAAQGVAAP